jgi:hypothetical protein
MTPPHGIDALMRFLSFDALPQVPQYGIPPANPQMPTDYMAPPDYLDQILWNAYGSRKTATPRGQRQLRIPQSAQVQDARRGGTPRPGLPADYYSPQKRATRSRTPQARSVQGAARRLATRAAAEGAATGGARRRRAPIPETTGRKLNGQVGMRPARNGRGHVILDRGGRVIGTAPSEDSQPRPRNPRPRRRSITGPRAV